MIAIAVSRADDASTTIGEQLLAQRDWTECDDDGRSDADGGGTVFRTDGFELREFDDLHLHLEGVADAFECDPDVLVFPSRHAGNTDELLTAHFTGNVGPAEHGGRDRELAAACPNAHREVVAALRRYAPDGYEVGMECTHHGPSRVGAPSMFVEIGSAQPQWTDPDAGAAAARAILDLDGVAARTDRALVGFGGGHYVPRFERVVRETDWAVGHVASDWALEEMGLPDRHRGVVAAAFDASGAEYALIEGDRPDLAAVVSDLGYRVVSETWVRETSGVPLDLVDVVEERLGPVAEGTRFGSHAAVDPGDIAVESLSEELLSVANGVDVDAVRAAVAATTVAYDTTQNGTRATGRVAVPSGDGPDGVIDALLDVLERDYDAVERDGDVAVVHETAFDPSLAADHGVPEGPKFGRLSDGRSVAVDGKTVTPEDVHVERTRHVPISAGSEP
ncbi:MAG: D-aminoacyl-tRNA deacylase [Haloarculaceae archaeon]